MAFFFVDHSSDCITVFFATVAGALSLALIVGVFVYYRQHENKHQLNVKEEPKLSGYGTNESKTLEEATNSFLLGPIKTPLVKCASSTINRGWFNLSLVIL